MADSKITALTAISTVDPTADPLVIVDVSDTSMAASGTTKKSTINQLLGAGGTATLASATITGDLTVDTSTLKVDSANNRVGIGTPTPLVPLHVETTGTSTSAFGNVVATFRSQAAGRDSTLQFSDGTNQAVISMLSGALSFGTAGSNTRYQIDGTGISTWSVGGSTAMTLNATGLGVGLAPANDKLLVSQTIGLVTSTTADVNFRNIGNTTIQRIRYDDSTGTLTIGSALGTAYPVQIGGNTTTRAVTIDASGNLILLSSNTPATLATNGQLTVNATSNTNLRFSYRGSDGVTRVANITLA